MELLHLVYMSSTQDSMTSVHQKRIHVWDFNINFRIFWRPIDLDPRTATMPCVLVLNYRRKKSPERYNPSGTFDVLDSNGNLMTPRS